jgi:signal peptidase I
MDGSMEQPPLTGRRPAVAPAPEPEPPAVDGEQRRGRTSDARSTGRRRHRVLVEWIVLAGGALLIAILIKTFLFQTFYIPSRSMTPTLQVGDRVIVNKLSYRLHNVNRGDIVVFENPEDSDVKDLVKRVVGLEGETVTLRDGAVLIDGRRLDEPYLEDGEATEPTGTFNNQCEPPLERTRCKIPAGRVLVLGDNRNESKDGRVFGPIDEGDIVGRVFVRIWPLGNLGFL